MNKKATLALAAAGLLPFDAIANDMAAQVGVDNTVKSKNKKLEHVLVTVPIHKSEAQTALAVTVLNDEELQRSIANTIGETLASMPGLNSASFGPAVGQPVIRGQQGARVSVLLNSTGSADASNVSADHAVSVEPVLAESIEVLRGPSTLLYGGGAIGGVVNVIDHRVPTTVPDSTQGAAEYRHGTVNDEGTTVFKLDTGSGNWALHIDGLYRETNNLKIDGLAIIEREHHDDDHDDDHGDDHGDEHEEEIENTRGFIGNSDSRTRSLTVGGSYVGESGFIGLAVNRLENEYGLPSGGHAHHEDDDEHHGDGDEDHDEDHDEEHEEEEAGIRLDIEQTRYDLRAGWDDVSDNIDALRWFLTYNDYQHKEIEGNGEVGTTFTNEGWENRLELTHSNWQGWHGVLGLQMELSEFAAIGEESFIPKSDSTSAGLFLVEDYHSGDWLYELGLRFDRDEIDPDSLVANKASFNGISASASALWSIDEHWSFGVALSRSERAPTVEELFSNVESVDEFVVHAATRSIEIGNPDLDQEVAGNLDVSLSWNSDNAKGFVTVFYNDFSDYIYLANTGDEQEEIPILIYDQRDAQFTGVEFEAAFPIAESLGGEFSIDFFGDYVRGELQGSRRDGVSSSDDVPRMPPRRLGSRLNFTTGALSAYVSVTDADDQDNAGDNEFKTDGYTRWDAGLNYTFKPGGNHEYLTFIKLKNMTDEEIRNSVSYLRDIAPEGGRSIEIGVRAFIN